MAKEQSNLAKHRLDFRTASRVFLDPFLLALEDDRGYEETRWNVIGVVDGRVLSVIYTERNERSGLSRQGEQNHMNENDITIHFELDSNQPPATDWTAFDQMTEAERHTAAITDPDALPATAAQLATARRVPNVRSLRRKLNLTQEQFAHTFHLSLGAVRDWEQGRNQPDHAALALLRVIEFNPELVQKALQ